MDQLNKKRYLVIALALVGALLMGYLTYVHYTDTSTFCDISEQVSCNVVTTSIYSEVFGLPVSIFALVYFLAVIALVVFRPLFTAFRWVFFFTALLFLPAIYFSIIEFFVLKAFCLFCESSKLVMLGILITSYLAISRESPGLLRKAMPILAIGIVVAGATYFVQAAQISREDYTDLAKHLTTSGWTYYRSYTCPNCKQQERLFGNAYEFIKKVECHPDGPGANPELCSEKRITKTPTWLLEKDEVEQKRLEGLQVMSALKAESGYQSPN